MTTSVQANSREIAKLFASMFISRREIRAVQLRSGEYITDVTRIRKADGGTEEIWDKPFSMDSLLDHIEGRSTYGHYLLGTDNQCKLFAFDIDLDKSGLVPTAVDDNGWWTGFTEGNPREVWLDRTRILERNYFKYLLRTMATKLARAIHEDLELQTAVAYSGAKGVHVYGFTGKMNAEDVRKGAQIVLDELDCFEPVRGQNFVKHKDDTVGGVVQPLESFNGLTVEIFPKQTSLDGKTLGNLMRLPLGRNLKNPKDPTFFLDLRGNFGEQSFMVRDPVDALTTTDQWA